MHLYLRCKYQVPCTSTSIQGELAVRARNVLLFWWLDSSIQHQQQTTFVDSGVFYAWQTSSVIPIGFLKIKTSHHHFYISVMSIRNTSFLVFKDTKADVVGHVSSHRAFRRTVNRKWSGKVRRSFLATHTYNIVNIVQQVQPRHCRNGSGPLNTIVPHFAKYESV